MNSALLGYIAAAIGVPLVFLLLLKLFPSFAVNKTPGPSPTEPSKGFSKWDAFCAVFFLLFTGGSGYFWWVLFSKIELLNALRFEHAVISVAPAGYIWAFPAMLAALGSAAFFTGRLLKAMLKSRYPDYVSYQNAKYGVNGEKLGPPILVIVLGLTLIMLVMLSNWYTLFTPNEVIVKPLFALTKDKLKYSDVFRIATAPSLTAPNGKIVNRREYLIKFASGSSWTTNLAPTDLTPDQKIEIAQYVSRMSGVPITEIQRFAKDDLY